MENLKDFCIKDYDHLVPHYGLDGALLSTADYMRILWEMYDVDGDLSESRRFVYRELLKVYQQENSEG